MNKILPAPTEAKQLANARVVVEGHQHIFGVSDQGHNLDREKENFDPQCSYIVMIIYKYLSADSE